MLMIIKHMGLVILMYVEISNTKNDNKRIQVSSRDHYISDQTEMMIDSSQFQYLHCTGKPDSVRSI